MSTVCFTSISLNYLAKARVLGRTVRHHQPDWTLVLCVTDRAPEGFHFSLEDEPFDRVIWAEELMGEGAKPWLFKHEVVEACTAVKGPALKKLLGEGADRVFYLDPDTAVLGSMDSMVEMLSSASILLTPHQLVPESSKRAIVDNEICSLAHGTYNLGFIAVRNDINGRALADWWSDRLIEYCVDDKGRGIFVDQKWCDLVPALFDGVKIVRDPGYNVASWNLSNRKVSFGKDGRCIVNGVELKFFHFTKLGPIGDTMTRVYAQDNTEVYELWSWYKRMVDQNSVGTVPTSWWQYGQFSNGVKIPRVARLLYRDREDLRAEYADPFDASERASYFNWLVSNDVLAP
jgi:hypothetical protein